MLIHAYRRTAKCEVELFGQTVKFEPNKDGQVVAEVLDEAVAARLLEVTEGYREFEASTPKAATTKPTETPPADSTKFTLTNGEESVDLSAMDDKALRAFAKANGVTVANTAKGDTIRKTIVNALAKG